MCGIQILIEQVEAGSHDDAYASIWANLTQINSHRGPDAHGEVSATLPDGEMQINLKFGAHVLHLRGSHTQKQPMVDSESGDIFCWNGEIFDGLGVDSSDNDGALLFDLLLRTKAKDPSEFIARAFSKIEGPYAFVYFDREQRKLWFSRDYLGRRSLLVNKSSPGALLISSVASFIEGREPPVDSNGGWVELPAQVIYCMDLGVATSAESFGSFDEYEWSYSEENKDGGYLTLPFGQVTLVSCDADTAGSGTSASYQLEDLKQFQHIGVWQPYIDGLESVLTVAIRARVMSIPDRGVGVPRVGVLFSGGVDCITIAALLARTLPPGEPVELFNVAFENPRQTNGTKQSIYDVPDRKTGRSGWLELCTKIDPQRDWRLVEVDVPYGLALEHQAHIRQLLEPSATVMDMSIGMALWFASRGEGWLMKRRGDSIERQEWYQGMARVLLLGMGADEQLGGYSRHRSAWDRGGAQELGREIRLDVRRIATRNLGRDDRVVSDNSKESRYPFLAANVVEYLSAVPLNRKMDMQYPRGIGEKLLLRLLAHQLGLTQACVLAKRAIQFGARTAKMESGRTKGQDSL
ncbi:hypothetical protein IWW37_005881 [Coemansia sp. RSA 2050]|nr:hypothetical protein IWW37_005881 [Coemansia sp. RSA 2050]KAJ2728752.1 hypothetical protein IW152_005870 [Coemansia sp. BCRC 34962]